MVCVHSKREKTITKPKNGAKKTVRYSPHFGRDRKIKKIMKMKSKKNGINLALLDSLRQRADRGNDKLNYTAFLVIYQILDPRFREDDTLK